MSVWMKINLNVIRRLKMALLNKAVFVDLQSKDWSYDYECKSKLVKHAKRY